MTYCDFGEKLKQLRKSRNLTQQELGSKIGLSKAVVSKYEVGLGYPSFDILIRFARFFGVTTDYLLGLDSNRALDVSHLTDRQIECVRQIIEEFDRMNQK